MSTPPAPGREPLWLVLGTETLFVIAGMAVGVLGVGFMAALVEALTGISAEQSMLGGLLASPLILFVASLTYRAVAKSADPAEPRKIREEPMGWLPSLGLTLLMGVALIPASTAVSWLSEHLFGLVVLEQTKVLQMTAPVDGAINPAVYLLAPVAVLLAPLAEEWLFRGWFFRRISLRSAPWVAYVASGLIFAAIHQNPVGVPIYLLQALFFGFAYARTGRLAAAVGVHFINNAITMAILVFMAQSPLP